MFKEHVFKMDIPNMYFKSQMNGFDDLTLQNFQFLSYSPSLKVEYRHEKAEMEYIDSYVEAAKIIAQNSRTHDFIVKSVIKSYSLALPCIFLCRQALELSMKRAITKLNQSYKAIHSLQAIWEKFEGSLCKEVFSSDDERLLLNMKSFIDIISMFDNENATKLRYSEDKNGNLSQNGLLFLNLEKLTETTELFIKQLELLMEIK